MRTADTSTNKATEPWLDCFVEIENSEVISKSNQEKIYEIFNATVSKSTVSKQWFITKKQLIYN